MSKYSYMPLEERLFGRLLVTESCILWIGGRHWDGYGQIQVNGHNRRVHRVVWEYINGPIPAGMDLDHLCRVRHCVNVDHLEVVTRKENLFRGFGHAAVNAAKTHCAHGHAFDEANTYLDERNNKRQCRECRRLIAQRPENKAKFLSWLAARALRKSQSAGGMETI